MEPHLGGVVYSMGCILYEANILFKPATTNDQSSRVERQVRRTKMTATSLARRTTVLIGEVRWRSHVHVDTALIHKKKDFEVNPLLCLQPVKSLVERIAVAKAMIGR